MRLLRRLRLLPSLSRLRVLSDEDSSGVGRGGAARPHDRSGDADARDAGTAIFAAAPAFVRNYRSLLRGVFRRFRRAGRGSRRGRRRRAVQNPYAGRNIRIVPYSPAVNLLALLPTVLEAVRGGRMRSGGGEPLRRDDLRGWEKTERESLTLVLLVDMSRSTKRYVEAFAVILRSLAGHFQRNRDRMGLVAIQGRQATVVHHPTHNYRIVTRHLAGLAFRGETPLADGLRKALVVARLERFKNPGSQSLVVLLSDCCPEPLLPGRDVFDQPSYREAQVAARLYRKERIHLLVLLPSPDRPQHAGTRAPRSGERLGNSIASLAGGRLIRLEREESHPTRQETERILGTIDAIFADGFRLGSERSGSGTAPMGSLER